MASSKRFLGERIQRILTGGNPSSRDRVLLPEIYQHIGTFAAKALKAEYYEVAQGLDGNGMPTSAMLVTFEDLPLESVSGNRCRFSLPASPMMLPEGVGVLAVFPNGRPEKEYLPIPTVNVNIWLNEKLCNPINTGIYTVDSRHVTIYDDLIGQGIFKAGCVMCVVDINSIGENEMLPISADQEEEIITSIVALYQAQPRSERSETEVPNPASTDR